MSRCTVLLLVALLVVGLLPAAAQYSPGDILVVPSSPPSPAGGIIYRLDASGSFQTVVQSPAINAGKSVLAAIDNRSVLIGGVGNFPGNVLQVDPRGVISTPLPPTTIWGYHESVDIDGSGCMYLANTSTMWLTVECVVGSTWSTFMHAWPPAARQVYSCTYGVKTRLDRNQIVLIYGWYIPAVYSAPMDNPNQAEFPGYHYIHISSNSLAWDMKNDPVTGSLLTGAALPGGPGSMQYGILRFNADAQGPASTLVVDTTSLGRVTGLVREPETGTWLAATWDSTSGARICRVDVDSGNVLGVLTSNNTTPITSPLAITIAGNRHVCGLGKPFPGGPYPFLVSFPGRPGAPYVAAASFGHRPAIPLGPGKRLHLAPDPLFFWSLTACGPFQNFQGRLDAKGEALAAFHIPRSTALSGRRFYVAAVTLKNGQIDGLSDPVGVTVQ